VAAAILTLVLTTIVSGAMWLSLGNLFRLHEDERQNDVLNLVSYAAVLLPFTFVAVFFAMERF
jgi:Mg2+ and Co2+ transporter CorA